MPASSKRPIYRFDRFELQLDERRLLRAGEAIAVGARGFDLLTVLVERAGHLVTKQELFARVWPKVIVDDSALQFQVSALRKILGAGAIATVSGRGYRLMPAVSCDRVDGAEPPSRLAAQASSFIGREAEIAHLHEALASARLVTLTGAGGCGKTRLATQAAAGAVERYPDGVWLVELAPLADPALLPQALMAVLGIQETSDAGHTQRLIQHLAKRRLLVLLDNAEHLRAACAELADTLLRACPDLSLLVTSRERLGLPDEVGYRVPSLPLPDLTRPATAASLQACDSARLFVERAQSLRPQFAITPQNAGTVALICAQLDGIPLAIELAAGRVRAMSVEEIGERLNQRFSLLRDGGAVLPRHRTLRSLIDWSYDLLTGTEQALLDRLSVFAGGCTLQAAEQVCVDDGGDVQGVRDGLISLADKNLLAIDEQTGTPRYRLLQTVHQYAAERLAERGAAALWKGRHLRHFQALAIEARPALEGQGQREWFDRLAAEADNIRAALTWSTEAPGAAAAGLSIVVHVGLFWAIRGQVVEGRAWCRALLAAVPHGEEPALRARALNILGSLCGRQGDNDAARACFEESLALFRQLQDQPLMASSLNNLAICAQHADDAAGACALYEEAIAIYRTLPPGVGLARTLHNLGVVMQGQGDLTRATALTSEALALERGLGNLDGAAKSLGILALIAIRQGRYDEARASLLEVLTLHAELGSLRSIAYSFESLAFVELETGGLARAVRLWAAASALRDAVGEALPASERGSLDARMARARAAMADDKAFDSLWQQGMSMTRQEAVAYALRASEETSVGA